jgi:hypothetical protein
VTPAGGAPVRPGRVRLLLVAGAAALVATAAYAVASAPPTPDSLYPKCASHALTGLHCPGCGTGRAAHALLNGRPLDALGYNLFAPLLLPLLLALAFRGLVGWAVGRPVLRTRPVPHVWLWALAAALVLYGVVRNIPAEPFSHLAPKPLPRSAPN